MAIAGLRILNLQRFGRAMDNRRKALDDRSRVNAQATVLVDGWIQKNFEEEGKRTMGEGGWKPLAAETIARRRKGKGGGSFKILQDTGGLKTRWKHLWSPSMAKIQSAVDYGGYHDEPKKPRKKLPLRRILPTNAQIWPLVQKLFQGFMKKVLR